MEANPRMNPSFILKRCKENSPNCYKGERRADVKGWMLKLVHSPFLISLGMDMHCQSSLELLPFLCRNCGSIALINYGVISIRLETQLLNNLIKKTLLASLWSTSVCWHKKVSEFQSWHGLSHILLNHGHYRCCTPCSDCCFAKTLMSFPDQSQLFLSIV